MSSKSERRAARETVAEYHKARLAELIQRVGDPVDRIRAGELDAFDTDKVIFQYSRAAKGLWKFCNVPDVEFTRRRDSRPCTCRLVGPGRCRGADDLSAGEYGDPHA